MTLEPAVSSASSVSVRVQKENVYLHPAILEFWAEPVAYGDHTEIIDVLGVSGNPVCISQ